MSICGFARQALALSAIRAAALMAARVAVMAATPVGGLGIRLIDLK